MSGPTRWPSAPTRLDRSGSVDVRASGLRGSSGDTQRARTSSTCSRSTFAELVTRNPPELVDLAGVPVRNEDRRATDPLVIAGGPCAYNPETLAE